MNSVVAAAVVEFMNTKAHSLSPLEFFLKLSFSLSAAAGAVKSFAVSLKLNSYLRHLCFDEKKRQDQLQKSASFASARTPDVRLVVLGVHLAPFGRHYAATKLLVKKIYNRLVAVVDMDLKKMVGSVDHNGSLAIEKTGNPDQKLSIARVHKLGGCDVRSLDALGFFCVAHDRNHTRKIVCGAST